MGVPKIIQVMDDHFNIESYGDARGMRIRS
jgi:hypothetical protein